MNYFNFLDNCSSAGKSIFQADSSQIQSLIQIVQNSQGLAGIYSMNLLIALNKYSYKEPYILPDTTLKDSRIKWVRHKHFTANTLKLYPNPARTYFIAEHTLKDGHKSAILEITDYSGKKIMFLTPTDNHDYLVIPVDKLPNGIYLCNLISGNKIIQSAKIVINK
jgi:hypothetical protein